ncbi:nucleolar protein 12-domain-containing protein [Spinellus fusiger]|nr:nucleolar protein 12-domain-containing protein [Spinellus fusiger]
MPPSRPSSAASAKSKNKGNDKKQGTSYKNMRNTDLLSAGSKIYAKKRKVNKETVPIVEFDFDRRKEFLTGFSKRKQERKKKTIEKYQEIARQDRLKARAEAREERKRTAEQNVAQMAELMRNNSGMPLDEDETVFDSSESDNEEEQVAEKKTPKVKEFKSASSLTTVTVIEDLDLEED